MKVSPEGTQGRIVTLVTSAVAPASSTKILVADDSEIERASARSALVSAGYEVVEAVDGQQALEVFARERPDLVMLDVVMPRLTGLETCRIIKAKTQSTYLPVIMVSTRNSVNARVEGLRSGADDYLGKPYDAEELRARVEALLRARRWLADSEPDATRAEPGVLPEPHTAESFHRRLEEEFDRAERYSDPLACLRVELDQREAIPARAAGNATRQVAQLRSIVESSVRKIDLVHRADGLVSAPSGAGDRGFVLLLPNTHFPGALAVAERVWKDVARLPVESGAAMSVSVGVSFYPNRDTHSLQDLLELVEAALTHARLEGGGKICLYQHQGYLYAPED